MAFVFRGKKVGVAWSSRKLRLREGILEFACIVDTYYSKSLVAKPVFSRMTI